jgi:hypothetical protein
LTKNAKCLGIATAAAALLALALFATPALAFQTHAFSTSFGTSGSGDGQVSLTSNSGVAVNSTTHDVYVADTGNARIDQFDSSGTFIRAFGADVGGSGVNVCTTGCVAGTPGSGPGAFTAPTFIAIDNSGGTSDGDVYVGDAGTNAVSKFSVSGAYISTNDGSAATTPIAGPFGALAGIAVDASGNLWVYDQGGNMFEFAEDGTFSTDWNSGFGVTAAGIAVDSAGNLYVVRGFPVVEKFTSAGADVGEITGPGFNQPTTGLAIDPSTGDLYVDDGGSIIRHYDSSCDPSGGDCTVTDSFGSGNLSAGAGLAVDSSNATVYAADTGDARVGVFTAIVLPDAITNPASAVQKHAATLNGHTDPAAGGDISDCHFDYTDDATFTSQGYAGASTIACDQATPISSPTDVTATPTGLIAGTTYHFRLSASDAQGTNQGSDQTFTTDPAVALIISPADPIGGSTATLNGHVDSNGGGDITDCHFDYTDDATFQTQGFTGAETKACSPATPISTATDVSADLTGLAGNTTYHVRLVATNADGTTQSADQPFTTLPLPVIDAAFASNLTPTEADLNATINPEGLDATYHFEWGTDTSYGDTVPVPDGDLGSGTGDVPVTVHLSGLSPDTTYHWRIIATDANGTVGAATDHTFIYDTSGAGLPDNRAYEMVTPAQKNGALINNNLPLFSIIADISASGSRVIAASLQCFADSDSCTVARGYHGSPYALTRGGGGWLTTALAPSASQLPFSTATAISAEAGTALFLAPTQPAGEDDWYARQPDGSLVDIGPLTPPAEGAQGPAGGSAGNGSDVQFETADLNHVVWIGNHWPFDATESNGTSAYQYAGSGNPQPSLIGVSGGPGSTDLISRCSTRVGGGPGVLSADGRTVYFTAGRSSQGVAQPCPGGSGANAATPVPADALYARIDASSTVAVSQRSPLDCTTPACQGSSPGDASFQGASTDGSRALFTSTQQLTDDATQDSHLGDDAQGSDCNVTTGPNGCNLYLYDFSQPAGHQLIDVSAGDTSGAGPRVRGTVAISSDASHVYFVANGVLTTTANGQGEKARDGADNLYLYERDAAFPAGHTVFIATLPASDSGQWSNGVAEANVTPDGRFFVLASHGDLTPDDTSLSGAQQIFRYDAQTDQLERISIGNDGFNDNGNRSTATPCFNFCSEDATIVRSTLGTAHAGAARPDPTMSHDGAYVFFQSPVALAPHALEDVRIGTNVDGTPLYAQNVYEWHAGHVSLVSDGRDTSVIGDFSSSVRLIGADATGANVFFTTVDKLVPQDTDTELDFYDARVGGGFPFTPPPEPCSGDNCKPPPSGAPPDQTPGSSALNGPGNQGRDRGGATGSTHKKRCKKHHKRKCKKSRRASANRGAAK